MTEQEQIEIWRKEFEKSIPNHLLHKYPSGTYHDDEIELVWEGFKRGKRSQPIVKLPKRGTGFYFDVSLDDVIEALTAAGIKYTIGE